MSAESAASTWSQATQEQLLGEVLDLLIRILSNGGLDPVTLSGAFQRAIEGRKSVQDAHQRVHLGAMQRDCMEVMCRWRRDRQFLDHSGLPSRLPVTGGGGSFEALCDSVGVTSNCESLLATLKDFGAVEVDADGCVRALTPTFLLGNRGAELAVDGVLKQLAGFLRVVDHNTNRDGDDVLPRFERMCTVAIAAELLPVFERTVRERGQEFIDGLDEWLERHRNAVSSSGTYAEVGAGAYFVDLGNLPRRN